jgi:hypothetical protein
MAEDLRTVVQDLRYHSDALPRLLEDLFGPEEGDPVAIGDVSPTAPDPPIVEAELLEPEDDTGALVEAVVGGQQRRRRARLLGAAAVVGAAVALGGLWSVTHQERPAAASSAVPGQHARR